MALGSSSAASSASQVQSKLISTLSSLSQVNNQLAFENQDYLLDVGLYDVTNQEQATEANAVNDFNTQINEKLKNRDTLEKSKENPMNKMYNVEKFVVTSQGMCGMGMGMGDFGKCTVGLSGKELTALGAILSADQGAQPSDVIAKLKEAGINAKEVSVDPKDAQGKSIAGALKKGIEITHADGSKTTIYDANGNGGLDTQDYNFNKSLACFEKDLQSYKEKIANIDADVQALEVKRDPHVTKLGQLTGKLEAIQADMSAIEDKVDMLETESDDLTCVYHQTETEMANIAEQNSAAYAEQSGSADAQAAAETAANEAQLAREAKTDKEKVEHLKKALQAEQAARAAKNAAAESEASEAVDEAEEEVNNDDETEEVNGTAAVDETEEAQETEKSPVKELAELVNLVRNDGKDDSETEVVDLEKIYNVYNEADEADKPELEDHILDATGYTIDQLKDVVDQVNKWIDEHTVNGVTDWSGFESTLDRPASAYSNTNNFDPAAGGIIKLAKDLVA